MYIFVLSALMSIIPAQSASRPVVPPYDVPAGERVESPTGFFHTRQVDGRWWFIDPKGCLFYEVGTDHVIFHGHHCEALGYAPYGRNNEKKYGSVEKWADVTADRLSRWGFNTLPWGHEKILRHRRFANIESMVMGASFAGQDALCPKTTWTGFPNVFSPDWPKHCEDWARRVCAPVKDDPWLIGYFTDNELEWYGHNYREWGLFDEAWKLPAGNSAKQAWIAFLEAELKEPAAFERGWGVKIGRFSDLAGHTEPTAPRNEEAKRVAGEFVREVARRYFGGCTAAIRKYDPNHLVLGCRFAGRAPDVWDVAGQYCDVVSVNQYPMMDVVRGAPSSVVEKLVDWHRQAGKPLMLTEWSFPAMDTPLSSVHGAGMRVETQSERAACFRGYETLLFNLPFMVGSNFFMWVDEPALGISKTFPENSNYGLVNEKDEPYAEVTNAAANVHAQVYKLHAAGAVPQPRPGGWLVSWLKTPPEELLPAQQLPLRMSTGELNLEGPVDGHAWRVSAGSTLLGDFFPMMHQGTRPAGWIATEGAARVTAVRRDEHMRAVDMELAYDGRTPAVRTGRPGPEPGAAPEPPRRYLTGWRFWVPVIPPIRPNQTPWFAAQCLWVENTDTVPWRLESVYYNLRPAIGGDQSGDEPLELGAPEYFRRGGAWIDRTVGAGIAAWFPVEENLSFHYWKDGGGGLHSDLYRPVGQTIEPGQRLAINGPLAFFFPLSAGDLTRAGFAAGSWDVERATMERP